VSCVMVLAASFSLLCSCATQPKGIENAPAQAGLPQEQIICEKAGDPLVVKLRLADGEEVPFLVDTGTSLTALDRSLERWLGLRLGTKRLNKPLSSLGSEKVSVYAAPKLYLGNVPLMTGSTVLVGSVTAPTPTVPTRPSWAWTASGITASSWISRRANCAFSIRTV